MTKSRPGDGTCAKCGNRGDGQYWPYWEVKKTKGTVYELGSGEYTSSISSPVAVRVVEGFLCSSCIQRWIRNNRIEAAVMLAIGGGLFITSLFISDVVWFRIMSIVGGLFMLLSLFGILNVRKLPGDACLVAINQSKCDAGTTLMTEKEYRKAVVPIDRAKNVIIGGE
jgi:hypothetical protein